jgi:hypothetical protein
VTYLISTLIAMAFASSFLVFAIISSYLFLHLTIFIHQNGALGISAWVSESKQWLIYITAPCPPTKLSSSK